MLPSSPVDVYVEGQLLKRGVANSFAMITPELPDGAFKYRVVIRDSYDSTRMRSYEITGIQAGKTMTVDLRPFG